MTNIIVTVFDEDIETYVKDANEAMLFNKTGDILIGNTTIHNVYSLTSIDVTYAELNSEGKPEFATLNIGYSKACSLTPTYRLAQSICRRIGLHVVLDSDNDYVDAFGGKIELNSYVFTIPFDASVDSIIYARKLMATITEYSGDFNSILISHISELGESPNGTTHSIVCGFGTNIVMLDR